MYCICSDVHMFLYYKGQESQAWKLLCLQNLFFLFSFCSLFYDTRKTSRNKVAIAQCGHGDFSVAFQFLYVDRWFREKDIWIIAFVQCTEVHFVSLLSSGVATMVIINLPERKLTKRTSAVTVLFCFFSRTLLFAGWTFQKLLNCRNFRNKNIAARNCY